MTHKPSPISDDEHAVGCVAVEGCPRYLHPHGAGFTCADGLEVQGHIVSLTQIERVARACESVDLAAAVVHEDKLGVQTLILYVSPFTADIPSVVMAMHEALPPQMLPHHTLGQVALPRTLKGAIDRLELQGLPPPEVHARRHPRPKCSEAAIGQAAHETPRVPLRGMVQSTHDSRWRCYSDTHRHCHAFPRLAGINLRQLVVAADADVRAVSHPAKGCQDDEDDDYWAAFEGLLAEEVQVAAERAADCAAEGAAEAVAESAEETCANSSQPGPTPAEVTEVTGMLERSARGVATFGLSATEEPGGGATGVQVEHDEDEEAVLPDPIMDRPVMRELAKAKGLHFWSLLIKDAFELMAYPEPEGPPMVRMGTVRQDKTTAQNETRASCSPA